jgi:hypothetical protein
LMPQRFALVFVALATALAGCASAESTNTAAPPSASTFNQAVPPPPNANPSLMPVVGGCPPDVNLMYEWLKATPAIMDKLSKNTTGLLEPTCYQGWSVARTVVKNADSALVLFKLDPGTGRWNPVAAGTDNICEALQVPAEVRTKLGPGC